MSALYFFQLQRLLRSVHSNESENVAPCICRGKWYRMGAAPSVLRSQWRSRRRSQTSAPGPALQAHTQADKQTDKRTTHRRGTVIRSNVCFAIVCY